MIHVDPPRDKTPLESRTIEDRLFVKNTQQVYVRILLQDILWLKGKGNYTVIHTKSRDEIVRAYLGSFLSDAYQHLLIRVHKSYIVNLKEIEEIKPAAVTVAGQEIPLAKSCRDHLIKRFVTF